MIHGVSVVMSSVIGPTNERYSARTAEDHDDGGRQRAVAADERPVDHRPLALVELVALAR